MNIIHYYKLFRLNNEHYALLYSVYVKRYIPFKTWKD